MKKCFLVFFLFFSVNLFSQDFINFHAKKLALEIIYTAQKNDVSFENKKLDIIPFVPKDKISDRYTTIFLETLIEKLQYYADSLNINLIVLPTDTALVNKIVAEGIIFSLDKKTYWERIKRKIAPDFYISGNFEVNFNDYCFSTYNVKIVRNLSSNIEQWNVKNISSDFSIADREKLLPFFNLNTTDKIAKDVRFIVKKLKINSICVYPINYLPISSPTDFSQRLQNDIISKLTTLKNVKVVSANDLNYQTRSLFDKNYTLNGFYTIKDNLLIITLQIKSKRKILFAQEYKLPASAINYKYVPANLVNVEKIKSEYDKYNFKGDFDLEVITNKGADNLVFFEGDTLYFMVKVSKPVYLRFVYILADGTPVLMLDNEYITEVDKFVRLEDTFICSEPFGTEILYVIASDKPLDDLQTYDYYGYKAIKNFSIPSTRGFIKKPKNTVKAQKMIVFTTMPKN